MDLQSLKRRDLQALCKKNNIPANMTNAAMADALKSLETIEGVAEILEQLEIEGSESPNRTVTTSSNVPQTSTRQKPSKEGLECSKSVTKTRYGTRRVAIDGADTRKTPATRTTRRRATQEASVQRKIEKDMQAKFEEDLDLSEVSEHYGVESTKSEEVSGSSVHLGGQIPSGNQNELGREIVDVVSNKDNSGNGDIVNESQEESVEKVDFQNLGRKDLQNLCKKNKIPANMSNAAMADALGSLALVEGLDEFLKEYDPFAVKSPETSRMTSSRARQAHTERKSVRAAGSALCKSLSKKMEDLKLEEINCPVSMNTDEGGLSVETNKSLQSHLEACLERPEFVDCAPENSSIDGNSLPEEISNEHDVSLEACGIGKELQVEMVENKSDERDSATEIGEEISGDFEDIESTVDEGLVPEAAKAEAERLGECIDNTGVSELLKSESESESESDVKGLIQETPALTQFSEQSDSLEADNGGSEILENDEFGVTEDINFETDESDVSDDINTENDESDVSEDINTENDESDVSEDELDVVDEINSLMKVSDVVTLDEDSDAPKAEGKIPLGTSLRELKKLLREKLQETNLLAKKMKMLTLKDNEMGVDSSSDIAKQMKEESREVIEASVSDGLNSTTTVVASTLDNVEDEGHDDGGEEATFEKQSNEAAITIPTTTPVKSSSITPKTAIKSSFKTPLSTGRTSNVLDANKENIDESCSKTEPGKIKVVLTPGVVSMGKLRKEVKVLLQQSEKKRPPLQSRSDNQFALTSP